MAKTMTGIKAALLEASGEGALRVEGKSVVFTLNEMSWKWGHPTKAAAEAALKVLRAAPKYVQAA